MYGSVQACVKSNATTELSAGSKIANPVLFFLLVNELVNEFFPKARRGIPFGPIPILNYSSYFFVDELTLLASTVIWVQNQLNVKSVAAERLCLAVNLDKSIVIVFRKYGLGAAKKKWFTLW